MILILLLPEPVFKFYQSTSVSSVAQYDFGSKYYFFSVRKEREKKRERKGKREKTKRMIKHGTDADSCFRETSTIWSVGYEDN